MMTEINLYLDANHVNFSDLIVWITVRDSFGVLSLGFSGVR
jgi:hypothetical protein